MHWAILFMVLKEPWSRKGGSVRVASDCAAEAM